MEMLEVNELLGLRESSKDEYQIVQCFITAGMLKDVKSSRVGRVVAELVFLLMAISAVGRVNAAWPLYGVISIFILVGIVLSYKRYKKDMAIITKLSSGNFQVIDCKAYYTFQDVNSMSRGIVKVYNNLEQKCLTPMRVDLGVVRTCEENRDTELLLVRCGDFSDVVLKNVDLNGWKWDPKRKMTARVKIGRYDDVESTSGL